MPAAYRFFRQLLSDARFYHRVTHTGRSGAGALVSTMLCNRGLWLLTFHRIVHYSQCQRRARSPIWLLARLLQGVGTCFNVLFCRSGISADCDISDTVYLSNRGYLLCGARSIGAGSLIHERSIFGYAVARGDEGRPVIGSNVWIGPDCIIAGAITVGDGATVLPGSFLTFSVPPHAVVKGNPALIVRRNFDNSALRDSLTVVPDLPTDNS
jgi:serine acetyltransferase